jgi:hypothetical protein
MAHKTDPCASTNCRPAPGSCRRTRTIPTRRPRLKAITLEIRHASTLAKLSGRWGLEARTRFHGQPSREGKASWGPANPAFRGRAGVAGGYSGPKPVRSLRRRRQPRGAVKGSRGWPAPGSRRVPFWIGRQWGILNRSHYPSRSERWGSLLESLLAWRWFCRLLIGIVSAVVRWNAASAPARTRDPN